ncbi:DegT/DnrJ/EryC1/StrS family aminotransferase [Myxococcota bacterium]|nr:DegT/DnrJ/EryC1/StrS family aminotransferase [Myxococcota bacterium]MBU1379721.1 DegT/DnrJ/EryC1/StrS family aminotransferase [Myxococcota bacterium]MBU1498812.1 DegT/DnrJ/EryC1/StrS family aminotransferase [Myxococcota bacterium]
MKIPGCKTTYTSSDYSWLSKYLDTSSRGIIENLEAKLAEIHNIKHVVTVSNGTAALFVLYQALGMGMSGSDDPPDLLIVPSYTWPSAANAAAMLGAKVLFMDINPDTLNIEPHALEGLLATARGSYRRIFVVQIHQFGLVENSKSVRRICDEYGAVHIEDAAWTLGSSVPLAGVAGIWSFHPRKLVNGGEGGAIYTDDDHLADACRRYRNHGLDDEGNFSVFALNFRLPVIQAGLIHNQLNRIEYLIQERKRIADFYYSAFAGIEGISLPPKSENHLWQAFVLRLEDYDVSNFKDFCEKKGVEIAHAGFSTHREKAWVSNLLDIQPDLTKTTRYENSYVLLPSFEGMTTDDLEYTVNTIKEALSSVKCSC